MQYENEIGMAAHKLGLYHDGHKPWRPQQWRPQTIGVFPIRRNPIRRN